MSSQQELSVTDFSTGEGDIESRGKGLATKCWDDSDDFLPKEKIAEWLGGTCVFHNLHERFSLFTAGRSTVFHCVTTWNSLILGD